MHHDSAITTQTKLHSQEFPKTGNESRSPPYKQLAQPPSCTASFVAKERAVILSFFTSLQNIGEPMQSTKASTATQKHILEGHRAI